MSLNNINHVCSIGSLCHSSKLIKTHKLKLESYPFDWIFSNLNMVQHCIEDNFKIFLDKQYYTRNINDKDKEPKQFHIYYYPNKTTMFNHRNPLIKDHYDYYIRCVNRFKILLSNKNNKLFIYFGNIDENKIIEFNNNLKKYTCNYRILVINTKVSNKHNYNFKTIDNIDYLYIETLSASGGVSYGNPKDNEYLKMIIFSKYKFQLKYLVPNKNQNIILIKNTKIFNKAPIKSTILTNNRTPVKSTILTNNRTPVKSNMKTLLISNKIKQPVSQKNSQKLVSKPLISNKNNNKKINALLLLKNKRK
jgi:hypothetical protein